MDNSENKLKIIKTDTRAVIPSYAHPEDIGLDLTVISKKKELNNGVILYDTGIAVKPPPGYYTEIIPRSSIVKTGWFMVNSVGIIDPNYTGSLLIAIAPLNNNVEELIPPFCKFQLVIRKAIKLPIEHVSQLEETDRGDGSFGSTG